MVGKAILAMAPSITAMLTAIAIVRIAQMRCGTGRPSLSIPLRPSAALPLQHNRAERDVGAARTHGCPAAAARLRPFRRGTGSARQAVGGVQQVEYIEQPGHIV